MKKLALIVLVLFMTGCSSNKVKTAVNINSFENVVLSNNLSINKGSTSYDNVSYITDYSQVILGEAFEMIVYSDSEDADKVQKSHIESFNLLKSTAAQEIRDKGKNYYHYALISNGRYMVSTRVDNTLIFAKVLLQDKDTVDNILNELGY